MTYFQNRLVTHSRVGQLFTRHQIWPSLIESITSLQKGQGYPIQVSMTCNHHKAFDGLDVTNQDTRIEFLVLSAMWWLIFFLPDLYFHYQLLSHCLLSFFFNICWLVRLFWGFTLLWYYFSHITTWKQEIPNLWNFSGETWSRMVFSIFVNFDLHLLLPILKILSLYIMVYTRISISSNHIIPYLLST